MYSTLGEVRICSCIGSCIGSCSGSCSGNCSGNCSTGKCGRCACQQSGVSVLKRTVVLLCVCACLYMHVAIGYVTVYVTVCDGYLTGLSQVGTEPRSSEVLQYCHQLRPQASCYFKGMDGPSNVNSSKPNLQLFLHCGVLCCAVLCCAVLCVIIVVVYSLFWTSSKTHT